MHIWNFFCNFVAVLGIVLTATINCFRVMNKEKVFSCSFEGQKYSIYVEPNPKREGAYLFWTYKGRKRLDAFYWGSFEAAVGSILMENADFEVSKFVEVWS